MNFKLKKNMALALIFSTGLLMLSSCGKAKKNSDAKFNTDDKEKLDSTINIYMINSESGEMKDTVLKGYKDALNVLLGKDHYTIKVTDASTESESTDAVKNAEKKKADLIFSNGKIALSGVRDSNTSIPVVSTGVLNFQSALSTLKTGLLDETGTNITGTSTISPMDSLLSLIIETGGQAFTNVGLFYSPEDDDAIYQNEALEDYMDDAGIPWKEYALTSSLTQENQSDLPADGDTSAITPDSPKVSNSIAGLPSLPDSIGEHSLIESPNLPTSARSSKVSANWTIPVPENAPSFSAGSSNTDIVNYAANECSILYIPGLSNIADISSDIASLCLAAGKPTVTNDADIGKNTTTCLYTDPYSFGYSAGKQTYRICVKKEKPSKMKIESIASSVSVKLYNSDYSSKLDRTFPKSFYEINDYLSNTPAGSTTNVIAEDKQK